MAIQARNLLFVFTDQQTFRTMSAYGNDQIETPNLDRLAGESMVFERAYCTQPLCTPARASLLTGLYPHTVGCVHNNTLLPGAAACLPELGAFDDYRTAYLGKWHLGDEVFPQHGFELWKSVLDCERQSYRPGRDRQRHCDYFQFLVEHGYEPDIRQKDGFADFSRGFWADLPEEMDSTAFLVDEANAFLSSDSDPFLLYLALFRPKGPRTKARDWQYSAADMPLPANLADSGTPRPLKTQLFAFGERDKSEQAWQEEIAGYWRNVSLVDAQLGRLWEVLDRRGLWDSTIVVFTSDHGELLGSHGFSGKFTMYEESVRVPLLLHIPGVTKPGTRTQEPVSQIDLVPTLLDALGQRIPDQLQGASWLPYLQGTAPTLPAADVFIEWNGYSPMGFSTKLLDQIDRDFGPYWIGPDKVEILEAITDPVRAVVTSDGWKYCYSLRGDHELYNLNDDPAEQTNLAGDPAQAGRVAALRSRIVGWQATVNDAVPFCPQRDLFQCKSWRFLAEDAEVADI